MFVRIGKYMAVAVAAEQAAARYAAEQRLNAQLRKDLDAARSEVTRLTNVIIRMKPDGFVDHAGGDDKLWGSYRMDDIDREQAATQVPAKGPYTEREVSEHEAEIVAELTAVIDAP